MNSSALRARLFAFLGLLLLSQWALAQDYDLSVTKTGPDQAAPGSNVSYQIVVQNGGPDDASPPDEPDPVRNAAAARFSRATVWKTSGGSGCAGVGFVLPRRFDASIHRVMRTASGIP